MPDNNILAEGGQSGVLEYVKWRLYLLQPNLGDFWVANTKIDNSVVAQTV